MKLKVHDLIVLIVCSLCKTEKVDETLNTDFTQTRTVPRVRFFINFLYLHVELTTLQIFQQLSVVNSKCRLGYVIDANGNCVKEYLNMQYD